MPITISRQTGSVSAPEYTPDQIDRAWEAVIKSWANAHRDELKKLADEAASGARGE